MPSHEKWLLPDKPEHIIIDSCFAIGIMKHSIIARWKVAYILNDWRPEQASFHQLAQRHSNRIPGRWKTDSEPFQRCQTSVLHSILLAAGRLSALRIALLTESIGRPSVSVEAQYVDRAEPHGQARTSGFASTSPALFSQAWEARTKALTKWCVNWKICVEAQRWGAALLLCFTECLCSVWHNCWLAAVCLLVFFVTIEWEPPSEPYWSQGLWCFFFLPADSSV